MQDLGMMYNSKVSFLSNLLLQVVTMFGGSDITCGCALQEEVTLSEGSEGSVEMPPWKNMTRLTSNVLIAALHLCQALQCTGHKWECAAQVLPQVPRLVPP